MSKKTHYEVRVREKVGPDSWIKKSKFYFASSPEEAVLRYQDQCKRRHIPSGHIMWSEKVSKEKVLGIGEFFSLGDKLLKEFKGDNNGSTAKETTNGCKRDKREWRREGREESWS